MPEAELIETGYNDEPRFASEKVDMIIMGAMTEHGQELAIKKLMPYRDRLRELIDGGVVFLIDGERRPRCSANISRTRTAAALPVLALLRARKALI